MSRIVTSLIRTVFHPLRSGGWVLAIALLVSACDVPTPLAPIPTHTSPPASETPTATIVWFPPTATNTPFATITVQPTPDQRPGIGALIFTDDFGEPTSWMQSRSSQGSVAVSNNELTIAIAESNERAYLYSLRSQPVFSNFYVELTASASLCRGKDEYGLLLRVSPTLDYYRFSLSCDGNLRLDRVVNGEASSPQPWLLSGAVPPGAPSQARLAVWAYGPEMRFFVNDEYQFSVRDPLLSTGSFGVFSRSASDMAVTINFLRLEVREISNLPVETPASTPSAQLTSEPGN